MFGRRPTSRLHRSSNEGGPNIRPVEIVTLEEEGLGTHLGQRIDRAIDDIQLSSVSLVLAETAKGIEGGPCHFIVERHHDNPGILQQLLEKTYRIQSQTSEENKPGLKTATDEINKLSAPSIAARKRELSSWRR